MIAAGLAPCALRSQTTIPVLTFDTLVAMDELPGQPSWPLGWSELELAGDRRTAYRVEEVEGRRAVCAESKGSASGLVRAVTVEPGAFPVLRFWIWVEDVVPGGNARVKEGDDFAARVFVNFEFDGSREGFLSRVGHRVAGGVRGGDLPGRSLGYVWANVTPKGTMLPNAHADRVTLVVIGSGRPERAEWRFVERDIVADFEEAFGHAPPNLHSVGVMSDSDNTQTAASACFGAITLTTG